MDSYHLFKRLQILQNRQNEPFNSVLQTRHPAKTQIPACTPQQVCGDSANICLVPFCAAQGRPHNKQSRILWSNYATMIYNPCTVAKPTNIGRKGMANTHKHGLCTMASLCCMYTFGQPLHKNTDIVCSLFIFFTKAPTHCFSPSAPPAPLIPDRRMCDTWQQLPFIPKATGCQQSHP